MWSEVIAAVSGIVVSVTVVSTVETIGMKVIKVNPPRNDDKEAMKHYIKNLPIGSLLFVLLAYFLGALFGGFVAAFISNSIYFSLFPGGMLTMGGIATAFSIPHPTWFLLTAFAIYLPISLLGGFVALLF